MCGIFGLIVNGGTDNPRVFAEQTIAQLAHCSESRGKDSSGFAFRNSSEDTIRVLRAPLPISTLMKRPEFDREFKTHLNGANLNERVHAPAVAVIGHSRLVTNGSQLKDENNQPCVKDGLVGVHNGIIVNEQALWQLVPGAERKYDIDTEVLLALFRHYSKQLPSSGAAMSTALSKVFGTVSTAFFVDDRNELILATNNGSLYFTSDFATVFLFASEKYTLERIKKQHESNPRVANLKVFHVKPNTGCVIDLATLKTTPFEVNTAKAIQAPSETPAASNGKYAIDVRSLQATPGHRSLLVDFRDIATNPRAAAERKLLEYPYDLVSKLRRCTKCVLPETFPFITFNKQGVCNYCLNYRLKNQPKPLSELQRLVEPYRRSDGGYDCIVPYSGGRDSTFVLHMIKKELGMNPIAMTYDWGMVTDLARRNIARVCGKLGVENIIVAADIAKKRRNINRNITAWLKRPSLGMIPLFMSGDKYFFYYTNQLKKQTGVQLNIWGINNLENTDFKTGFAGVPPKFDKKRIYSLGVSGQLRFFSYVAGNIVANPSYINSSNLDSIGSIVSRYMYPQKDYYSFFDYYAWNEQEIENVIFSEYDWERAIDTRSTWRIGDGTASFYNYIYYTVAGFSENDTFRSNQIREGLLTRDDALTRLEDENMPRYENLKWYLEIVGVDFESTIKAINRIPKLYA